MGSPRLQAWFADYATDHQHPTNRRIHKIAVPVIVFALVAALDTLTLGAWGPLQITAATAVVAIWAGACVALDRVVGTAVGLFLVASLAAAPFTPLWASAGLFTLAWIFQFVGHYGFEKRSPSFFDNALQLFVGPLFVSAVLLGRWPGPSAGSAT